MHDAGSGGAQGRLQVVGSHGKPGSRESWVGLNAGYEISVP